MCMCCFAWLEVGKLPSTYLGLCSQHLPPFRLKLNFDVCTSTAAGQLHVRRVIKGIGMLLKEILWGFPIMIGIGVLLKEILSLFRDIFCKVYL